MLKSRSSERIEYIEPDDGVQRTLFDLSKGGACCLYAGAVERGGFVLVTLEELTLRAKVTYVVERTDGVRVGLQFWNVSGAQQKTLDELVEKFSRGVPVRCHVDKDAVPGAR